MAAKPYRTTVALVVLSGLIAACARSPESTVQRFYYALEDGDISEAQFYLSAEVNGLLGAGKVKAVLTEQARQVQKCGGIDSIDVSLEGEGKVREGPVIVHYKGDCKPERNTVKLVYEDGEWKIGVDK